MNALPGWYDQPDGSQRFWDGNAWTQQTRWPSPAPAAPATPAGSDTAATSGTPFYRNKVVIGVAAVVVLFVGFSASKGGGDELHTSAALVPVVTATATVTATEVASPTATATVTVEAPASSTPTASEPTAEATTEAPSADESDDSAEPKTFKMPKVVGKNLQWSQDKLQSLGSWIMDQEDAAGLDRWQVNDSNWKVCSQKPKAGKVAPVDTTVVLKSVKYGEKCPR